MLLNGGVLDGVRLLGPKTVELMTTSHTLDLNLAGTPVLGAGAEWGLGFKITSDSGRHAASRVGRHVRLGRHLRDELLGRSEREAGRRS